MEQEEGENAIVTDVEEPERPLSQREEAMQKILAGREEPEQVEEEIEETPVSDDVVLKVDGVEITAPKNKVLEAGIRSLQKESAADYRLQKAAEKEAEVNARLEELKRMEQDLLSKRDQEVEPDETGRAFADALFTDEETVAKTITNITRQLAKVSGKVEEVEQKEVAQKKATFDSLVKHYHDSYPDIAADPDMHFALNRIKSEVAQENPSLTQTQLIDKAAERVYQKFGGTKEEPKNDRQKAKERMPVPTKKASARVEPTPAEKPKKTSDVLNAMRLNRGPRAY